MSDVKIIFEFKGMKTTIKCDKTEKMRSIMKRYGTVVAEININKIYLVYNGNKVNEELSFEEIANKQDKKMNMMNIIIYEINNSKIIEDKKERSKEIISLKEKENYIISEIEIKEKDINKDIRIINSFEEVKRINKCEEKEDDYKYENEKEIKENCIIEINAKIIPFSYFYKFKEKGKYKIKYSFKININKTDYMFYECGSLTNINLSNFNTQNVINMSYMFYECGMWIFN